MSSAPASLGGDSLLVLAWATATAALGAWVSAHVPEMVMVRFRGPSRGRHAPPPLTPARAQDEVFHVPQTQRYCSGDWQAWDAKITTFPGTYWLGAAWAACLRPVLPAACTTAPLRALNVALGAAALASALRILAVLRPKSSPSARRLMV